MSSSPQYNSQKRHHEHHDNDQEIIIIIASIPPPISLYLYISDYTDLVLISNLEISPGLIESFLSPKAPHKAPSGTRYV